MADRHDDEFPDAAPERDDAAPERGDDPEREDIVRRHLTRAWQAWAPSPDLDARVRARLTSSGAATMGAVGLGAATSAGRPSPWGSLQATGKLGALVGAGLLGVGFFSGYLARSSLSAEPRPMPGTAVSVEAAPPQATLPEEATPGAAQPGATQLLVAPASRIDEPPPTELGAAPEPEPAARSRERASGAARRSGGPPLAAATPPAPNEELALLQRAERAVRADNAALALALIGELEARHPHSTLLEERGAIELLAHCQAGATDAGRRATRFLRAHPSSLYAGRIRELCPASSERRSEGEEPR